MQFGYLATVCSPTSMHDRMVFQVRMSLVHDTCAQGEKENAVRSAHPPGQPQKESFKHQQARLQHQQTEYCSTITWLQQPGAQSSKPPELASQIQAQSLATLDTPPASPNLPEDSDLCMLMCAQGPSASCICESTCGATHNTTCRLRSMQCHNQNKQTMHTTLYTIGAPTYPARTVQVLLLLPQLQHKMHTQDTANHELQEQMADTY
jgi:hypothetical protein